MAVAWFIVRFNITIFAQAIFTPLPCMAERNSALDEPALLANGGRFRRIELSDRLIYKISASQGVLDAIAALPGVKLMPTNRLDDALSTLTVNQRNALKNELLDQGYTQADIDAEFPNLGQATLRQMLKFMSRTKTLPAFDVNTLSVIRSALPEDVVPCEPDVDDVETSVS